MNTDTGPGHSAQQRPAYARSEGAARGAMFDRKELSMNDDIGWVCDHLDDEAGIRLTVIGSEADQDYKDGAALRRLREALTPAVFRLTYGRQFAVTVDGGPLDGDIFTGATPAEAATKCREALG